jgi:hypothetical protein
LTLRPARPLYQNQAVSRPRICPNPCPFAGLGTVPVRALRLGRRGRGVELNPEYFGDAVRYLTAEAMRVGTPSLFDLIEMETAAAS